MSKKKKTKEMENKVKSEAEKTWRLRYFSRVFPRASFQQFIRVF
jgi:hypothetical protein